MFKEMLGPKYDAYLAFVRKQMIKDQIESRGVRDPRVLAAMQKVCRHCFVTEDMVSRAYEDYPLPIHANQTISQPYIVALMSELMGLRGGERVLEIGTGSGYQTAVLAELAGTVDTVEILPELAREAKARLEKLGYSGINYKIGSGEGGWPERAPYDAIIVTCAAKTVPVAFTAQLKEGGRLVIPVGEEPQELRLITKTPAGLEESNICAVRFVPMLSRGS